jgi:hypothetical protein
MASASEVGVRKVSGSTGISRMSVDLAVHDLVRFS